MVNRNTSCDNLHWENAVNSAADSFIYDVTDVYKVDE